MYDETYEIIGYIILGFLGFFVLFNLLIIVWDGIIMQCVIHCRRRNNIIEHRQKRHKLSDLNRRSLYAAKKLREWKDAQKKLTKQEKTKTKVVTKKQKVKKESAKKKVEVVDEAKVPLNT